MHIRYEHCCHQRIYESDESGPLNEEFELGFVAETLEARWRVEFFLTKTVISNKNISNVRFSDTLDKHTSYKTVDISCGVILTLVASSFYKYTLLSI